MNSITVQTIEGRRYGIEIDARSHSFPSDEPEDNGGDDLGPSPYELLLAALGSCTAITLRMYAERKQWPLEGLLLELSQEKVTPDETHFTAEEIEAAGPDGRVDLIRCDITFEGPLDVTQRERLMEIAARCPVHRTLSAGPKIVMRDAVA